jgi:hypothetical protein
MAESHLSWDYAVNMQLSQTGRAGSPLPAANGENQVFCLCLSTGAHGFLPGAASSPEGVRRPAQIVCHVHYPNLSALFVCRLENYVAGRNIRLPSGGASWKERFWQ